MPKRKTPEQLREMVRRGLIAAGVDITPEVERAMADIPERDKRPTPESKGMSEPVMVRIRNEEIAWFRQHPAETEYIRRLVPGELPPDITAEWVRVRKLSPNGDQRLRTPVVRVIGAAGIEWRDWKKMVPDQGLEP